MDELIKIWYKSSVSLEKIQKLQKPSGDKTGLFFSKNDSSLIDNNSQVYLDKFKAKYISFVRSSTIYVHQKPSSQVEKHAETMKKSIMFGVGYVPKSTHAKPN